MKVLIETNKKEINTISNHVQTFRESFLRWSIDNESPAKYPADIILFLRMLDEINSHFNAIMHKLWDMEQEPDETRCVMCEAKEKTIQLLKQDIELKEKVIDAQHSAIFGKNNNLKVCKKED